MKKLRSFMSFPFRVIAVVCFLLTLAALQLNNFIRGRNKVRLRVENNAITLYKGAAE